MLVDDSNTHLNIECLIMWLSGTSELSWLWGEGGVPAKQTKTKIDMYNMSGGHLMTPRLTPKRAAFHFFKT